MKKGFIRTTPSCCYFLYCLLTILFVEPGLFAQQLTNTESHLLRITDGIQSPVRLAIDGQGVIYVSDAFQKSISKYDASGNFLETIYPGGFPVLVTVSNDNQLLVSDNDNGNILQLKSNGESNKIYSSCTYPSDAAFDGSNRLYVVDSKQKQVIVLDLSGKIIQTFGADILILPTGIAYDQKNARILVAEHGGIASAKTGNEISARILAFDLQGNLLDTFGNFGFEDGQFTRIQGLAVDQWGRIFVVDNYQATVSVFSENGDFITRFGEFGDEPGQLNAPMDIVVDSKDRIWITSMNTGSVEVFSTKALGLNGPDEQLPLTNELLQNYPNPFRQGTWIPFVLAVDEEVTINIYSIGGTLVRTFKPGMLKKGNYTDNGRALFWDGTNDDRQPVGNGIYFYELRLSNARQVKRMIFLK